MDVQSSVKRFDEAVHALPERIKQAVVSVPDSIKKSATEVRLRVNQPVSLCCMGKTYFVSEKHKAIESPHGCFPVTREDLAQSVISMCAYSVHSHQHELSQGYISLKGGHRAGICGTASSDNGKVTAVRDITSINIRIAREIHSAAASLTNTAFAKGLCGTLIVGAPSSGKTTILRDLARRMSSGEATGCYIKTAVVDERGELGAVFEGIPQNNLGICCDILSGYPKGFGILTAVRTLSPDVIICDEIGGKEETVSILDGIGCGVKIIAAAHAGSLRELLSRRHIHRLLEAGAFEKIVMLKNGSTPGVISEIVEVGELCLETDGVNCNHPVLHHDRNVHVGKFIQKSL